MGEKLRNVVGWATDLINPSITLCSDINLHSLLSLQDGSVLSVTEYIAGTILAIVFFILLMSILSYGLSVLSVGETIILTILKKKSNDENLLERDDEDTLNDEEDDDNENKETKEGTEA